MASRLRKGVTGALTALGISAVAFIGTQEGLRLKSYPDIIGVWTACYGETKNIKPGMTFTKPQCDKMLADRLVEFETNMRSCLKAPDQIPDKPYLAFLSLAYNIGSPTFCKSTIARKANAGDLSGACDAITLYNRAGGKVVKGLVDRRERERAYCKAGI
ncbi:lysozyme [Brucella tritici]|uniref:Lysozyme n=1 Tax=Brucella tritici TaxID=94626 RepID=A0A7X6FRT1_9HYPH|nr:lysozyme [Brucella tritici]KAB2662746.1 lysozyme [Brucella tritici]NKW09133.1 lysozyme [Brucella tritici]